MKKNSILGLYCMNRANNHPKTKDWFYTLYYPKTISSNHASFKYKALYL